jgi:hypothetical protein
MEAYSYHSVEAFGLMWTTLYKAIGANLRAWHPKTLVSPVCRTFVFGGAQWQIPLEIRLYRCALMRNAQVRLLWRKLEAASAGV